MCVCRSQMFVSSEYPHAGTHTHKSCENLLGRNGRNPSCMQQQQSARGARKSIAAAAARALMATECYTIKPRLARSLIPDPTATDLTALLVYLPFIKCFRSVYDVTDQI